MEIVGVKSESTDFPPEESYCGYSRIGIDEIEVGIKEEEYEDAPEPITTIPLDTDNCERNGILKYTTIGGDGRYMCQICSSCFSTRKLVLQHIELHVEKNNHRFIRTTEANHKCDVCTKLFATMGILQTHMKAHTTARNYKCEICDKGFLTKRGLLQHVVRHTGERNHKCQICNKCFTTKHVLLRHVKAHAGEKNHKCEICDKRFTTKQHLGDHVNRHTGERSYECEICNKCFSTKQYLSQHVKRHTGERNYECEICNKCSTTKQDLARHVARHTGENNFKCEICPQVYRKRKWLLRHVNTHTENSSKVQSVQYCPRVISMDGKDEISKFEKPLVKMETGLFVRNNLENNCDAAERKPLLAISETRADVSKEDDARSTKIFNLLQTLHNEVTIKEEHVMDSPLLIDTQF